MTRKNNKRGFTIVELVIVIAVIAILAAVLVPVFAGLINKAELSADQTLVRNLNTSLALSSGAGQKQNDTMYDTLEDIKDAGYVVENLTPTSNGNEIVWDKNENQFVLVIKNKDGSVKGYYTGTTKSDYTTVKTPNFWKIYKEMPTEFEGYSIYLSGTETDSTKVVKVVGVGFDAGLNKVSVEYKNGESSSKVIIRTYFGNLTVDAGSDDISHYGVVKNLTVKNVNNENCYHERGFVYNVNEGFESGKFVAENKAVFHQTREQVETALNVSESENKSFESKLGAQYSEHYFVDGKCAFEECGADKCQHIWNDGEITTEPTCVEAGLKTYTCTLCGKTRTEGISRKGHSYDTGVITTEPTCTSEGVKTFTCIVCSDKKTESVPAKGHTWSETLEHDKTYHWKKCSECSYKDTKTAHSFTYKSVDETNHTKSCECGYSISENHNFNENGECLNCGYQKPTIKNGLSNGLYYENGELKTGSVTDAETGKTYTFKDGILVLNAEDTLDDSDSFYKIIHTFDKTSIDSKYLTDKVKLIADSAVYGVNGMQGYVRNYLSINFDGYTIENAKFYSPSLYNDFNNTPWTSETINKYLKISNETCGNSVYADASALPFYIQGKDYDGYNSLSENVKDVLTYSEYLKLKYRNNVIVTGENSAIFAYFVKTGTTEKLSAYAYRNDEQGIGIVIGNDGKIYAYAWAENDSNYPEYQEIKNGTNTFIDKFLGKMKFTIEKNNDELTIKYNEEEIENLDFTLSAIENYNLSVEKENIIGKSIYDECSSEELLTFATMPGQETKIAIDDDPEIAELYLKAFWNQYYIKVYDSKTKVLLENVDKNTLSGMSCYAVYFTNGIGNSYQKMEHIGPVVEILITKNA